MNAQFEIESTFTLASRNQVYVSAKLLTPELEWKTSDHSKLGEIDIENWFDISRSYDEKGNIRLCLFAFILKNNSDRDKISPKQVFELFN